MKPKLGGYYRGTSGVIYLLISFTSQSLYFKRMKDSVGLRTGIARRDYDEFTKHFSLTCPVKEKL